MFKYLRLDDVWNKGAVFIIICQLFAIEFFLIYFLHLKEYYTLATELK